MAAGEWAGEAAWSSLICCSRAEISDCSVGTALFSLAMIDVHKCSEKPVINLGIENFYHSLYLKFKLPCIKLPEWHFPSVIYRSAEDIRGILGQVNVMLAEAILHFFKERGLHLNRMNNIMNLLACYQSEQRNFIMYHYFGR